MLVPSIILAIAWLLIFLEFYLPGGFMGAAGAVLLVASIVFAGMSDASIVTIFIFILVAVIGLIAVIKFAMYRIQNAPPNTSVYSEGDQKGYVASEFDQELLGKEGVADSDLRPSGFILVNGQRKQAVSKVGYIPKGTPIKVLGGSGAHLIVKSQTKAEST
ncbi:MAG: serine protease [Waddliaceae bacterium]|nr:serine protease [Waddliaceae bacterium]